MTRTRRLCVGYELYVYSSTSAGPAPGIIDLVLWRSAGAEVRIKLHPKAAEALAHGAAVSADDGALWLLVQTPNRRGPGGSIFDAGAYDFELQIQRNNGADSDVLDLTTTTGTGLACALVACATEGRKIQEGR
jgi:hypothetical protein